MPIASKLVYFQRRPAPAPEPEPEPPDPRRGRPCRDRRGGGSLSSSHHKPVQDLVVGKQRDAGKPLGLTGAVAEHAGGAASRARLNRSVSDHGRLPDAVRQARERLLQRLNSVDLSGRRQKTWPSENLWAGLSRPADPAGVSTSSADSSILGSLTNCLLQPAGEPVPSCKVDQEISAVEQVGGGDTDESTPVTLFPQHDPAELKDMSCRGEAEEGGEREEPSAAAECSICLERCEPADGLTRLRCEHVFHSACLGRWLRAHRDCPYCRASVVAL